MEDIRVLKEELEANGQSHIFETFPNLTLDSHIVKQLVIECQDWKGTLKNYAKAKVQAPIQASEVSPVNSVVRWNDLSIDEQNDAMNVGITAIQDGKVAAVIMSGGQGTRLGFDGPKGMFDINLPSHKSIFQIHIERLLRLKMNCTKSSGAMPSLPIYIMTSSLNDAQIKKFFESQNFFGYPKEDIVFFEQRLELCLSFDGKIIIESKESLSMAPDGNGGLYEALRLTGALQDMNKRGVQYLHIYGVDNMLTRPADPGFLGLCIGRNIECGNKVVWRSSKSEKVGVTVQLQNNRMCVVEYSDITKEMADATDDTGRLVYGAANICNHFVSVKFITDKVLNNLWSIYHLANKKIPYLDVNTMNTVHPAQNNGIKLELFIFDVFPLAVNWLVMDVDREDEFAPVKNAEGDGVVDSPATARALMSDQYVRWLKAAGASVNVGSDGNLCEISTLLSYNGENLEKYRGATINLPCYIDI